MKFEDIFRDLKNKIYKPIYFLSGEEAYFIDQITDYISNHVLDESEKAFNQTVLYGKDSKIEDIIKGKKSDRAKRIHKLKKQKVRRTKRAKEKMLNDKSHRSKIKKLRAKI